MSGSKWNMVGQTQKVVLPQFIYDSIKQGKMADCRKYGLVDEMQLQGQTRLDSFYSKNDAAMNPISTISSHPDLDGNEMVVDKVENVKNVQKDELDLSDPRISSLLVTNPVFIPNYFASSRLHHLSIWKNELISKTSTIMNQLSKKAKKESLSQPRIIMHVDMDCFFVSVALRILDASLKTRPVVVAHSHSKTNQSELSTSEIASCNYIARAKGIKNGSYLGKAKSICRDLVVLDYDYEAIAECTAVLYDVLVQKSCFVQAVSCDEALIDVTDFVWRPNYTPSQVEEHCLVHAQEIRKAVEKGTKGCCASIGIGWNPLQARIATFFAKPNGIFVISPQSLDLIFHDLPLSKIPGIGSLTLDKFHQQGVQTCLHAQEMELSDLQTLLGEKTGEYIFDACRGIDRSVLENKVRTSCSVEINWGVRFRFQEQVKDFMMRLASYLFKERLENKNIAVYVHLTLKAKKRNYKGEPSKFLGCGHCIDYSKAISSAVPYTSSTQIFEDAYRLLAEMQIPATEIRGVGIHLKPKSNTLENGQRLLDFSRDEISLSNPISIKEKVKSLVSTGLEKSRRVLLVPERKRSSVNKAAYIGFKETFGMNPSQVDIEILKNLPPDIVQEFEKTGYKPEMPKEGIQDQDCNYIDFFPSFSQIDKQILKELPKDIQNEQRALALAVKQKRKRALKKKQIELHYSEKQKLKEDDVDKRPALASEKDPQVIIDYIIEWIESFQHRPCENQDIDYLILYLKALIDDMQLERCSLIVKYLSHQVGLTRKGKSFGDWVSGIEIICHTINEYVLTLYGSELDESFRLKKNK